MGLGGEINLIIKPTRRAFFETPPPFVFILLQKGEFIFIFLGMLGIKFTYLKTKFW